MLISVKFWKILVFIILDKYCNLICWQCTIIVEIIYKYKLKIKYIKKINILI